MLSTVQLSSCGAFGLILRRSGDFPAAARQEDRSCRPKPFSFRYLAVAPHDSPRAVGARWDLGPRHRICVSTALYSTKQDCQWLSALGLLD